MELPSCWPTQLTSTERLLMLDSRTPEGALGTSVEVIPKYSIHLNFKGREAEMLVKTSSVYNAQKLTFNGENKCFFVSPVSVSCFARYLSRVLVEHGVNDESGHSFRRGLLIQQRESGEIVYIWERSQFLVQWCPNLVDLIRQKVHLINYYYWSKHKLRYPLFSRVSFTYL